MAGQTGASASGSTLDPGGRHNGRLSYTNESGRIQILNDAATAVDDLAVAIAGLGEAYEHLDDQSAERMEDQLFRPLQAAYGQLKRTHADFAARYGLPGREFHPADPGLPADSRILIERAADSAEAADSTLAELQDSLLPVEVGDELLRAGLARARTLIAPVPAACRQFIRTLGR
jgi:hypothetical protein